MLKQHWKASNVIVQANHHGPEKHGRGFRTWLENRLQNIARMTRKPLVEVTHAKPHAFVCIHGKVTGNPWKSIEISYESVQSLDTVQFVRLSKSEPSRPSFEVRLVQRLDRWLSLGQGQLTWKAKEPLRNRFGTALERGLERNESPCLLAFSVPFPGSLTATGAEFGSRDAQVQLEQVPAAWALNHLLLSQTGPGHVLKRRKPGRCRMSQWPNGCV